MHITHLRAENWRNFRNIEFDLGERLFIVGANASGKSNLLDVFRFLSDIASSGGGLRNAVHRRGGIYNIHSVYARNNNHGWITIAVDLADGDEAWRYTLSISGPQSWTGYPIVEQELVEHNGKNLLSRPNDDDRNDEEQRMQTHLEQVSRNRQFRIVADFLSRVDYFHPVPQIIRDPDRAGTQQHDPYGGDFIAHIEKTPQDVRRRRLNLVEEALKSAIPGFQSLSTASNDDKPHLVAGYRNWRPHPTQLNEQNFSDGTLRLIGMLWEVVSVPSEGGVLLLEEPELSLNSAIVRTLPAVLATAQQANPLQVVISTHSPEILDDETIRPSEVLVLQVTDEGTNARLLSGIPQVRSQVEAELPISEIVDQLIAPRDLSGLVSAVRSR